MTAKGKITAARVQVNDRIIVRSHYDTESHGTILPSANKTGEGVRVVRVLVKRAHIVDWGRRKSRVYEIITTHGTFRAVPVQTMWLAPEDAAGVNRAHAEALELDKVYEAYPVADETPGRAAEPLRGAVQVELPDPDGSNTLPIPEGPWFQFQAGDEPAARRFADRIQWLMETIYTGNSKSVNHGRAFDAAMHEDHAAAHAENRRRWQEKMLVIFPAPVLDHRYESDSPGLPCQAILTGLDPSGACGRDEQEHGWSAWRVAPRTGPVVSPPVEAASRCTACPAGCRSCDKHPDCGCYVHDDC